MMNTILQNCKKNVHQNVLMKYIYNQFITMNLDSLSLVFHELQLHKRKNNYS